MEALGPASVVEYANTHNKAITQLEGFRQAESSDISDHLFFSAGEDAQVRLWDLRTKGSVKKMAAPWFGEEMGALKHCPKSNMLLVANQNGVAVFDLRSGNPVKLQADFENQSITGNKESEINSLEVTNDEKFAFFVDDE